MWTSGTVGIHTDWKGSLQKKEKKKKKKKEEEEEEEEKKKKVISFLKLDFT